MIKEIKNTVPWTYVIDDLNGEEIIGTFHEKELQKTNQEEFKIKKVIKKKGNKLYVKWKRYDNTFNSWIDKKRLSKMNIYIYIYIYIYIKNEPIFSKPYEPFGGDINAKVHLSNYATKTDFIKNITC